MSVLLPLRGSIRLNSGAVYEVQTGPCILYVAQLVTAEQSDTETFDFPIALVFTDNHAIIAKQYVRIGTDVSAAIKKDPFAPAKR